MKVVHLGLGAIPVPPGDIAAGSEEYIYQLTDHLGHLDCQVDVIDIKGGKQQREKRQRSSARFHELWHFPLPYRYRSRFFPRLFYYLRNTLQGLVFALLSAIYLRVKLANKETDIIHTHEANVCFINILASKLRRNRAVTVYTFHSALGLTKLSWQNKMIYFTEILALKWADHVVALTPSIKNWLVSEYKLDPNKITPILGGGAANDEIEQFLSHKERSIHQSNMVLCIGVLHERKNQFTAVKAISKVVATYPEVRLVFVGQFIKGSYFDSIQKFIAENNLSSCVEFRGEVSRQELYDLYSEAAVFLFPTTAEIRPAVLVEALSFGLPIVATNITAIADLVGAVEGSAILLEPYDVDGIAGAVIQIFEDDLLRQTMSKKARELSQALSYENIAEQTLALYNKLVQDKKGT